MRSAVSIEDTLCQFTGSTEYFRHVGGTILTEGAKFLADEAGAYWLMDVIASYQPKVARDEIFQLWTLKVNPDKSAVVEMRRDSDEPAIITQVIEFTDFPLDEIKLYCVDGTIMLPSEY